VIGDVSENSLSEVINSEKFNGLISRSIPKYNECSDCAFKPYCVICPVVNYANDVYDETSLSSKIFESARENILSSINTPSPHFSRI